MTTEITITTERIDDFPLLLETMIRLGLPDILDRHLGRHGLHQGLSWGWIATIWLAHILTQSDHRKRPVQTWVRQAQETIERITGQRVRELDFTDDRLTLLLRRLSKPATWEAIERELGRNILRVYELTPERVRLDPTTISGYHAGSEDSLFQYGYSKDDPSLRQVKLMVAALDPLGLPLVTQVVAGDTADDNLYKPAVDRVLQIIDGIGLLFVGDSKMSALAIRAHIHHLQHHYLCPLAQSGETAKEMEKWIEAANNGTRPLQPIYIENAKGERKLLAEGYVFERTVQAGIDAHQADGTAGETQSIEWIERVLVVRSEGYRKAQLEALENRLQRATDKLLALTPPPGRGKRQIQDESDLVNAAAAIFKAYEVEDLLSYTFERQEKRQTKYIGRGRGNPERPRQEIVTVRYQITSVTRQAEAIAAYQKTLGWRVYVSNAPAAQLSLEQAVLTYRDEWIIERGFHRLKGVPLSLNPLFVKRDDQVMGLTNLLSIAVRLLTLIEFVVRRKLKQNHEKLTGLIENNPKKGIDNPTTERLLKEFDEITLTIVHLPGQIIRHVTPLTELQTRILELLGLSATVYTRLAEN
ncbi:MAG: IS1634 family transposase [Nanoarchaeota archaeon]|nr:IS1634 family transposase [Nanoarchaeota archaeon]